MEQLARSENTHSEFSTQKLHDTFDSISQICSRDQVNGLKTTILGNPQINWDLVLEGNRLGALSRFFDQIATSLKAPVSGIELDSDSYDFHKESLQEKLSIINSKEQSTPININLNFDFEKKSLDWFQLVPKGNTFAILAYDIKAKKYQSEDHLLEPFKEESIFNYSLACYNDVYYFYLIGLKKIGL